MGGGKVKNIKIITFGNFPYGRASANYLRNFAFIISQKHNVEVLLPTGYNYGEVKNKNTKRKNQIKNVKYRHFGYVNRPKHFIGKVIDSIFGKINLYFYLIKSGGLQKNIDLVIKYNISFFTNIYLILLCKVLRIKLINILPEFYPKPNRIGFKLIKWYHFYLGIKHLSKYCDGIIPLTNYLARFVKCNKYEGNILLLPNIVDPTHFEIETEPFKPNFITIGYTGTPTKKDGIDELLKSFAVVNKKYPNTHLLIIGDTAKNSSLPSLQEKAKQLGINNSTSFTGLVSYMEIPVLLNSCDILILIRPKSIQSEAGFPTKLGEYMACKKPVVLSGVGDMKEYFSNKNIVKLVEPENIESITKGIEELILNKKERYLIGNAGYNWMQNNLSVSGVSKKVHYYIDNIL